MVKVPTPGLLCPVMWCREAGALLTGWHVPCAVVLGAPDTALCGPRGHIRPMQCMTLQDKLLLALQVMAWNFSTYASIWESELQNNLRSQQSESARLQYLEEQLVGPPMWA